MGLRRLGADGQGSASMRSGQAVASEHLKRINVLSTRPRPGSMCYGSPGCPISPQDGMDSNCAAA